jgi:hypothetical protein
MKIKKAPVFGETKGFCKISDQNDFKPLTVARQRLARCEVRYAA